MVVNTKGVGTQLQSAGIQASRVVVIDSPLSAVGVARYHLPTTLALALVEIVRLLRSVNTI